LAEVAAQIRKAQKVVISAESILRNGAIISESGSLMVALAAKKYNIEVIVVARGFCLTEKSLIDQHTLLSENPTGFFEKQEEHQLKVFIGKRFDLVDSKLTGQIINEMGTVNPSNLELHFASYYNHS
jgi:translation initiation factor 2B subunit (eIF-2B alpha/beta/delta family)